MTIYQMALLIGAIITVAIAHQVPRAMWWVLALALSFVLSTMWQEFGLPHREAFGTVTDLAIVAVMYVYAMQRWELWVMNCVILMILFNWIYALRYAGLDVLPHYWLITGLEVANWMAIIIISATGLLERQTDDMGVANSDLDIGWADRCHRILYAERSSNSIFRR